MTIKRPKPEEIVVKLRQVEVLMDLFILPDPPDYIPPDHGLEFGA